jgi:hypothetical protein
MIHPEWLPISKPHIERGRARLARRDVPREADAARRFSADAFKLGLWTREAVAEAAGCPFRGWLLLGAA